MTPLEQFIATGEIVISNDPTSGFARKAILSQGFHWFPTAKQIILNYEVNYYEVNEMRFPNYFKGLVADNNTIMEGTDIPEYQYFVELADNPVNIFKIMYNITMLRDSQGKFNI